MEQRAQHFVVQINASITAFKERGISAAAKTNASRDHVTKRIEEYWLMPGQLRLIDTYGIEDDTWGDGAHACSLPLSYCSKTYPDQNRVLCSRVRQVPVGQSVGRL